MCKTMFSEQLPAAARCCRGACARPVSINKIMFSVLLYAYDATPPHRENKNPAAAAAAATTAAAAAAAVSVYNS